MNIKIGMIGDKGSTLPFKSTGMDVFVPSDKSVANILKEISGEYGIIYITEDLYRDNVDVIDLYSDKALPAIIAIPGREGTLGIAMDNIHKNVEKAVGADIFENENK